MVHSLAVPLDASAMNNLVAAARGDGCVAIYDQTQIGAPQAAKKPPSKGKKGAAKVVAAATSSSDAQRQPQEQAQGPPGVINILQPQNGGHKAAVNCVAFIYGSGGQRTVSVGNDRRLVVWDCRHQTPLAQHKHNAKMNWVCSSQVAFGGYDAFAGDVNGVLTCWNTCIA